MLSWNTYLSAAQTPVFKGRQCSQPSEKQVVFTMPRSAIFPRDSSVGCRTSFDRFILNLHETAGVAYFGKDPCHFEGCLMGTTAFLVVKANCTSEYVVLTVAGYVCRKCFYVDSCLLRRVSAFVYFSGIFYFLVFFIRSASISSLFSTPSTQRGMLSNQRVPKRCSWYFTYSSFVIINNARDK